jgi:Xaa-Pro aminopeptidase
LSRPETGAYHPRRLPGILPGRHHAPSNAQTDATSRQEVGFGSSGPTRSPSWRIEANTFESQEGLPLQIESVQAVQTAAKSVLVTLGASISSGDTERSIASRAVALLQGAGLSDTWYYDCPALVLLGSRSCLSASGRDYVASDEPVGHVNLVTVDLSPVRGDSMGDCARTFCVEGGHVVDSPERAEFRKGLGFLRALHEHMRSFATPDTTYSDLFEFASALIREAGFVNLDARGNLGHSLTRALGERRFVEAGSTFRLGDAPAFTFEPHVRELAGAWGFKHEDVYYFGDRGQVEVL